MKYETREPLVVPFLREDVRLGQRLHQRQPDAQPAFGARGRPFALEEQIEDPRTGLTGGAGVRR